MRLRRIESKIEHITYRVGRYSETTHAVIEGFLNELTAWKDAIPLEYHNQRKGTSDYAIVIDNFVSLAQPLLRQQAAHRTHTATAASISFRGIVVCVVL